jgi:hypothetical protein
MRGSWRILMGKAGILVVADPSRSRLGRMELQSLKTNLKMS